MPERWTKWWWLRLESVSAWSADQRRAASAVYGTLLVCFLFAASVFAFYISRLKFDLNVTLIAAIAASLFAVVPNVRGITSAIFPGIIKNGDEAAANRVGDVLVLPGESPGLWWINYGAGTNMISSEEQFVRVAIFIVAMLIFVPSALYLPRHMMIWFELSKRTSILSTLATTLPLSYFIGRKLIVQFWPEVARTADEKASARFNHRRLASQD
jgi:hypothetical protein